MAGYNVNTIMRLQAVREGWDEVVRRISVHSYHLLTSDTSTREAEETGREILEEGERNHRTLQFRLAFAYRTTCNY